MIAWSLILIVGETKNWKRSLAILALLCILASAITSNFQSQFNDNNWKLYSKDIGNKDLVIPINPPGWQIQIKAHEQ